MTNRIYLLSAALVMAGCSSAAQGAPNTAVVTQGGPEFVESYDAPPADAPELDGAPPVVPPPIAPTAELRAPAPAVVVVQKVKARFSCDIRCDARRAGSSGRIGILDGAGRQVPRHSEGARWRP